MLQKEAELKEKGGREQVDMGGLLASQNQSEAWVQAAAKDHV